jgi:catechol 2,3-dioxygenase-like lactoylglutathione lyase family enzyme
VEVEHVDFISIVSQDVERSRRFYLETLGLP